MRIVINKPVLFYFQTHCNNATKSYTKAKVQLLYDLDLFQPLSELDSLAPNVDNKSTAFHQLIPEKPGNRLVLLIKNEKPKGQFDFYLRLTLHVFLHVCRIYIIGSIPNMNS